MLNGRVTLPGPAYLVLPCHVPPARVLVRFLPILRVPSYLYLYCYGLSTRRRLLVCLPFPLLCCRLVSLCFSLMSFSFCVVNSSLCLPLLLTLSRFSLLTHLLSRYFWTLTRYRVISLSCIFVLVSRVLLYIQVGDVGRSPSSIYFATTLKV